MRAFVHKIPLTDRYVIGELLGPFLLGVGAFLVILIGDILYTLVEFIAVGRLGASVTLRLLVYKLPAILVVTLPVSTLFGTLLGIGRLAKDREIVAMRLSGRSLSRIFTPVLLFGLLIAGLAFTLNEFVAPQANHLANNLIRRAAFGDVFPQVREQVFFRGPGNRIFYVGRSNDALRVLEDVLVYEPASSIPRLIIARRARWAGRVWFLMDGVVREFDEEGFTRYEAKFSEMRLDVGFEGTSFFAGQKTPEEMSARELQQYLAMFGSTSTGIRFAVEYHRKFAVPLASAIFATVGAPLAIRAADGGRFLGVGLSIALLFMYYAVMSTSKALGAIGALTPVLAAWAPNLLFAALGLFLWMYEEGWLRLK
jgi:LPS export ABC transporter permease LptG